MMKIATVATIAIAATAIEVNDDPCDICNTGVCAPCKPCVDTQAGPCAPCWAKQPDGSACLPACKVCWGTEEEEQIAETATSREFLVWSKEHGKEYGSEAELTKRYSVWKSNNDYINQHNALVKAGKKSFTMRLNKFGDMTNEEYKAAMFGRKSSRSQLVFGQQTYSSKVTDAPDTWDWRDHNIVNPIKDQAQCGSCWAFSAVAAMEGAFNYANNATLPAACKSTSPRCSFSEQELVDCVNKGADNCDEGGEMSDGVMEIVTNHKGKINTEEQYPYTSGGGTSKGVCHSKDADAVDTGITGFTKIKEGDEDAMKQAVYDQTIISIAIDASQMSFQFYWDGVYDEPKCMSADEDLDHGVSIVGYGSSSSDYWVVRNSWGKSWGMDGYILMSRNKNNQCGVATDSIFANLK